MNTVIVSGGLDSTILYYAMDRMEPVKGLHFLYGSRHEQQETASCDKVIPDAHHIELDFSFQTGSALMGVGDIPDRDYDNESLKATVVPFRNGIMLAYAVALTENIGGDSVFYGAHNGDHAVYPDCRSEFVFAFALAAKLGTNNGVTVVAPFVQKTKAELVTIGHDLGIDEIMAQTWSCYKGGKIHCGICSTCRERKKAFIDAGVEDMTNYVQ